MRTNVQAFEGYVCAFIAVRYSVHCGTRTPLPNTIQRDALPMHELTVTICCWHYASVTIRGLRHGQGTLRFGDGSYYTGTHQHIHACIHTVRLYYTDRHCTVHTLITRAA
jgi:hypothetical protein